MRLAVRFALIVLFFLGCTALVAQPREKLFVPSEVVDSLKYASLDKKIDEYCSSMKFEPVSVQMQECDFLIETCTDSLVRQHVATTLYEKYRTSKMMGVESVAIHLLDKWFFSGKVSFYTQIELLDAHIYADFNRQSLVGAKAPQITLLKSDGSEISLFDDTNTSKRFTVLFFYDAQCSKCKVETILLRSVLENDDFPVDFYAVYTGTDAQTWKDYVETRFVMSPVSAAVTHLWDPECDSDFQRKFGVLQTPRMFLISPNGTILGRALDARALAIMLKSIFKEKKLEYGSDESVKVFDSMLGQDMTIDGLKYFADHLAETALPKGDTLMFRQMSGDFLYYLSANPSEASREGLNYLIDNYILNRRDIWKSEDDSLKIIGMAQMMNELLSKAEPGTNLPSIKLPGKLVTFRKAKVCERSLRRIGGQNNIIIFYTDGCVNCDAQKNAALDLVSLGSVKGASVDNNLRRYARNTKIFMVNIDEIISSDSQLASLLFGLFDLSSLPYIVITDKRGTILRRYVSLL